MLLAASFALLVGCGSDDDDPSDAAPRDAHADAPVDSRTDVAADEPGMPVADAASPGGDADAAPADAAAMPDLASDAPGGRRLSLLVEKGPWETTSYHDGLAADGQHRVFRVADQHIHLIQGATVSTYLTIQEAVVQVGLRYAGRFVDVDIASDGVLHALLVGTLLTANTSATLITQSAAPHVVTAWRDLSTYTTSQLSVIGGGKVAFTDYSGLWVATMTSQQLVFPDSKLQNAFGAGELTVNPSGVFLYLPGGPVLRGNTDGSSVAVLYQPSSPPIHADRLTCTARDPAGGFFLMANDGQGEQPRLYHLTEDASGTTGITHVVTTPSFGEAQQSRAFSRLFSSCRMATAPDGTIYVQTGDQIWKVSPP
jgi:hypothetical protein